MKLLGIVESEPLFQFVKLPKDWRKEKSDDILWSWLLDNEGRKRARIFFEATIGRRNSRIDLLTRFDFNVNYDPPQKNRTIISITDCGTTVHSYIPKLDEELDIVNQSNSSAYEWLDKNYPDWRNPAAYWG